MLINLRRIPSPIIDFTIAVVLASALFHGVVRLPDTLENPDAHFWTYAKGRVVESLSTWSEYLGVGHPATIYRKTAWNLDDTLGKREMEQLFSNVNQTDAAFNGVDVRIFEPIKHRMKNSPAIVYFHDGLWIAGSVESSAHFAAHLVNQMQVVVVSVDYRLAPEHPFPAPFDDCYQATKYLLEHGESLGVNPSRLVLSGIGAGANLAAAVSLKLRDEDRNATRPIIQVLINPLLQPLDFKTPSYDQNQYDSTFPKSMVVNSWLWYAMGMDAHKKYGQAAMENLHTSAAAKKLFKSKYADHKQQHRYAQDDSEPGRMASGQESTSTWNDLKDIFMNPYFAPLLTEKLDSLPDTYIMSCGHDVAKDDALMLYKRMDAAEEAEVVLDHKDKCVHGMVGRKTRLPLADEMLDEMIYYVLKKV